MWQKYDLNSKRAKQEYQHVSGKFGAYVYHNDLDFSQYSPAYLASNENVGDIVGLLKPAGKTALTVMASGDIPLFLSGYGARRVDTFDISINAYLVMRIKMNMLKSNFEYKSYKTVLDGLSDAPDFMNSVSWDVVYDTFQAEPDIMQYLRDMNGYGIFGAVPGNPYWNMGDAEYVRIKKFVPKSYKFIWTDLYKLPERIGNKKYDIIYLSNILQYAGDDSKIAKTVDTLQKHLNSRGVIVLDSLNPMYSGEYDFLENLHRDVIFDANACSVFLKTR